MKNQENRNNIQEKIKSQLENQNNQNKNSQNKNNQNKSENKKNND